MCSSPEKFNLLFSGDHRKDLQNLSTYIRQFYAGLGIQDVDVHSGNLAGVVGSMIVQFPNPYGSDPASPFKKAAAFTCYFVATRPIFTPLPEKPFGPLANCQNAIVALSLSIDGLEGATIQREDNRHMVLSNRITMSRHYWKDLVLCFSRDVNPCQNFNLVSMIYEALAYQNNPDASYERVV